jgi:hypothetical protein
VESSAVAASQLTTRQATMANRINEVSTLARTPMVPLDVERRVLKSTKTKHEPRRRGRRTAGIAKQYRIPCHAASKILILREFQQFQARTNSRTLVLRDRKSIVNRFSRIHKQRKCTLPLDHSTPVLDLVLSRLLMGDYQPRPNLCRVQNQRASPTRGSLPAQA